MNTAETEAVRERLEEIAEANGGVLTPEAVVADARHEDSPLHNMFDWNVRRAAEKHWLDQARVIIRGVRVKITIHKTVIEAVGYVRNPHSTSVRDQGYVHVRSLRQDEEGARAVLVEEFTRIGGLLERARKLAKVFGLDAEVSQMQKEIARVKRVAATASTRAQ